MGDFRNLEVWQLAKDLSVDLYKLTNRDKFAKDFGLKDQLRRAGVSIISNIAEGDENGSDKQSIRYFYIAKGSVAEVISQIIIAFEIGYMDKAEKDTFINKCELISKKLYKLIHYRSKND